MLMGRVVESLEVRRLKGPEFTSTEQEQLLLIVTRSEREWTQRVEPVQCAVRLQWQAIGVGYSFFYAFKT